MFFYNKKAFTLNEVMLAVVIIAVTFIPIVGVLTSSFKTTEKDDHIIKAMQLCQEKLGTAVQFPFGFFARGTYNTTQTSANSDDPSDPSNKPLKLVLGEEEDEFLKKVKFSSTLVVEEPTMSFNNVPVFDFTGLGDNPNYGSDPSAFVTPTNRDITGMVKRYTVTVTWEEKEKNATGNSRFYTLSTLKVDVRR